MLRYAATSTRYSGGKRNVIVCAGIQKNGIVFIRTNEINPFQSIRSTTIAMVGFLPSPYLRSRYVSVNLWNAINVGANVMFIKKLVKNANASFESPPGNKPFPSALVTPPEKIEKIKVMTIPRNPQIATRHRNPGAFFHSFVLIRTTSISPIVAKSPNLIKPPI